LRGPLVAMIFSLFLIFGPVCHPSAFVVLFPPPQVVFLSDPPPFRSHRPHTCPRFPPPLLSWEPPLYLCILESENLRRTPLVPFFDFTPRQSTRAPFLVYAKSPPTTSPFEQRVPPLFFLWGQSPLPFPLAFSLVPFPPPPVSLVWFPFGSQHPRLGFLRIRSVSPNCVQFFLELENTFIPFLCREVFHYPCVSPPLAPGSPQKRRPHVVKIYPSSPPPPVSSRPRAFFNLP